MKFSNHILTQLSDAPKRARRKMNANEVLEPYFEEPIIHRQVQGDKVYVPLNLSRAWDKL